MPLRSEVNRIARHIAAPVVVLAVERGWLPAAAQGDVTELLVIVLVLGGVYVWSRLNARPEIEE